ncbi:PREDICTED: LRR receptor-like serine/threonine-protein kinase FLS2 [Nicotiana attenuata]|uniref:Lrr receptor-like serinethreonine-protein kinase gso2 n=1 Tax=Nicotiana attenuata TaxID=49451 RepID=A0A1J6JD87_NICAT|nr:PREDICTED: LRR receptor-like serine/threonine-protein kinase FLS2 [Nicotiana attenuata]OIT08747.1 lrr receptor-like serinethreonine-protein kinase gso2 [Nicotiana attenuata]
MKVLAITFCFFFFFILTNTKFSVCIGFCRENEQQALESLKKEVYDPTNSLSSWIVGKDCCEWEGVVCHNLTRHVIELHIGSDLNGSYDLRINNFEWLPSLFNLENLNISSVDLGNATNWLHVINMLPSLVDLRLYDCSLQHIPPLLYHNFSSLETLDLSMNNFSSSIPKWIFNLPSLVSLDLSDSNLIGPFPEGPVNFTSLTTFRASGNSFNCLLPRWLFDLNNLQYLELRTSGIEGAMPCEARNVTKLKNLDLTWNNLNSTIPNWLYQCKDLESLSLSINNIEGVVSNAVTNLSSITSIDLSENMLSGKLPNVIGKLSKLGSLVLFENQFEGEIFELFNSRSNFLPAGLRNRSSLTRLRLGNNKLTGILPESLGQLSMLEWFDISNNRLEGFVTESHFTNWTQLRYFFAYDNNLTLKVSHNWIPPFQVIYIAIGGWNIGPLFPMWFQTQKYVQHVDISNGGIQGEVPTWFWNISSQFEVLDLSHNQFVGEVPTISTCNYCYMLLGSNNFSGPLPQVSPNVVDLDLSNNSFSGGLSHFLCEANKNGSYRLEILNLEGNDLSGEIPDCWMNWPQLMVLNLGDNNLIGGIPRSMEVLCNLKSLDLRRNRLTDPLPSSLANCTKLLKIDLAENEFVGQLPPWLGMKFLDLIILSLSSNKFYGELPPEICHLKELQILDLANNSFFGTIPRCISNLTTMVAGDKLEKVDIEYDFDGLGYVVRERAIVTTKDNIYQYDKTLALVTSMDMSNNNLSGDIPISFTSLVGLRFCNFSKNHLTGRIPNGIGDMKVLESLDLSENQLSGQIPQSLSSLSTLSFLNLSYNNLSGKIPVSTQFQSFNFSSFQGNELCGLPLLANCSSGGQNPNVDTEKDESDEDELDWFYIAMSIGFGLSFWGVCSCLLFKRSWRHAYYRFLDSCWESLCVKIQIWGWI